MPNVGYATLQIIPSVRGIGAELRRQLVAPAGDAGGDAGDAAGSGFGDAFKGAMAAIGVTELAGKIGEQFTEAFNSALEQGNVTSTLSAQLGSSGKTASKQGAAVGALFAAGVTDTFEQGAETVRSIVSGGLVPPDASIKQIKSIGTEFTDVANTFGTDMSLQSQAVAAILKNKLAPDATSALDLITVGFQKLGPNAEDLLETFQEYPVQLKKLGLDAQTSMGLFQQGLQGGARDTDIVADSLKEFSIRSIDMSATSVAAYKALGLSAEDMSLKISKGGDGATAGLQTVLDKLRAIDDPVKRNAAAVGLFGTQAEELGTALFKLDPGKASKTFADVGGAADQLGKTLRSGPSYEITLFKRTLQQGLVNFIGGQVLPVLARWGSVFNREVLPPIRTAGGVLSTLFLPTLIRVCKGLSGTVNWFREWGIWLAPLAIIVGGLTLALNADAIAIALVTGVMSAYRAAILIGTAVTGGFSGAMGVLNAIMALNPITLIVIALVALGAALFIAWKKSDTFRAIVMAAWSGIKMAAMAAWTGFIKPAIDGFMVGLRAVGAAASWLWTTLGPVFGFIGTAAKILATIYAVLLIGPWILGFKAAGAIVGWLWTSVIQPVIPFIVGYFKLLWAGAKLYIGLWIAIIKLVGATAVWLWKNAISPVVGWIVAGAKFLWSGVRIQFNMFVAGLHALGAAGTWLYKNAINPTFHSIATVASWLYDKGIKPPIDKGKQAAHALGTAFTAAKDVIGSQFGKIADLAKKPISFVINTVYNKGIVGVWNSVASAFGAPKLKMFKGFRTGGPVDGPGSETSDSIFTRLSRNEHVWSAKEVRGAGGHGAVMALRQQAKAGRLALPGFKDGGGLFGWVGSAGSALKGAGSKAWDFAKKGAGWLKDTLSASARAGVNAVVNPLLQRIPGRGTGIGDMVAKIPAKMISSMFGYAKKADDKGASSIKAGPGALGKWIAQAMKLTGVPASWAGPLRTLIMRESGGNPNAINLTDSNAKAGYPSQGLMQTIPQTFAHYRLKSLVNKITDPIANIVAGIRYIKSVYGSIFNVQQAVGSTPKGYAAGTMRAPAGWAWVGENGPELMNLSGGQTILSSPDSMAAVAAQSAAATAAAAGSRAAAPQSMGGGVDLSGLTLKVFVGSEELSHIARSEVYKATGELIAVIDAGGGN